MTRTQIGAFVLLLCLAALILPCEAFASDSSLVAYWSLNEGAGTSAADASGNGNNGTLMNGTQWTAGKRSSAVSLDGADDYIACMNSPSLDIQGDLTITLWVRFSSLPGPDKGTAAFVGKSEGGGWHNKWIFAYNQNTPGLQPGLLLHIIKEGGPTEWLLSSTWSPVLGQWYYVAVVGRDQLYEFYVDGQSIGQAQSGMTLPSVAAPLEIGSTEGIYYHNGNLDEIRMYSGALSREEIYRQYLRSAAVGLWSLDEGAGIIAFDSSGLGNNVIFTGAPTWVTGVKGTGLSFDGTDDRGSCPNNPSLDPAGDLTVATFVKFFSLPSPGRGAAAFVGKSEGGGWHNKWIFAYNQNTPGFQPGLLLHIIREGGPTEWLLSSTWSPVLGQWYYVAVVGRNQLYEFYVDGQAIGEAQSGMTLPSVAAPLEIGSTEGIYYLNGSLDEVIMAPYAMTTQELLSIGRNGSLGGDPNNDQIVNISDVVYIISYIFSGGPAPSPLMTGDVNCDMIVNISDAVYLIAYIFSGGPAPCGGN